MTTTMSIIETAVTTPEFKNRKLAGYTAQIMKTGLNIKKSYARIASIVAKIDESECYLADGFASVHDYTEQVLGVSKSVSYAMLSLGKDYIDGKTYESKLPHAEGKDFSTSQLRELLPLKSVDTATMLVNDGLITADMSCVDIRQVVRDFKSGGKSEGDIIDVEAEPTNDILDEETLEAMNVEAEPTNDILDEETLEAMNVHHTIELVIRPDGKPAIVYGDESISARDAKKLITDWLKNGEC